MVLEVVYLLPAVWGDGVGGWMVVSVAVPSPDWVGQCPPPVAVY